MLRALRGLGFSREAYDYFGFVAEALGGGQDQQIMYGVGGQTSLDETTLNHLSGYEGARPFRVGNGAYTHQQNDVWGADLDFLALHTQ